MRKAIVSSLAFRSRRERLGLYRGIALTTGLHVLAVVVLASSPANGQTHTTLVSFTGSGSGSYLGMNPDCALTISGTTLFGTTNDGGNSGNGSIFSVGTDGTDFQSLISFSGTSGSYLGKYPTGRLTLSGSTLYGVTYGGTKSNGNIFSIGTNGTGFQNMLSFNGNNGANPCGGLTLDGSTLYGVTSYGSSDNAGSVFRIGTDGSGMSTLTGFSFGSCPEGILTLSGSTLYGTTCTGGAQDVGTVFRVNTDGSGFQTLLSFSGTNGNFPCGTLAVSGSRIYGTTQDGGTAGLGNIFSINTDGTNFHNLVSFTGDSGAYLGEVPIGLILSNSTLYGVTGGGGSGLDGTVFSIHTDGTNFQSLYSFSGTDGHAPSQGLLLSGSTLYGTTNMGGLYNDGTVFALTLPAPEPSTLTLLTAGAIGLFGYVWRRRKATRTAKPVALDQQDDPQILSFPSHSSVSAAQRAA